MATSVRLLPSVDSTSKDAMNSNAVPHHSEATSAPLGVDNRIDDSAAKSAGDATSRDHLAAGKQPQSGGTPSVRSPGAGLEESRGPHRQSNSANIEKPDISGGPLLPLQTRDTQRMPILSSTEETQPAVNQQLGSGSPVMPRRLGGLFRSHSKENSRSGGNSGTGKRNHSSGRKGSAGQRSGSGTSQELPTSSFSAAQTSGSRQPSVRRQNGQQPGVSDTFSSSISSPVLAPALQGSRHARVRTESDAGQLPMVSLETSAFNTSYSDDPFNTSRTLRGARAVLRRKPLGSFRMGTSRTGGPALNGSVARRNSLNNRTISFVGADDVDDVDSRAPSEYGGTPTGSPRQRTRTYGANSSSTASTGRAASGAAGGLDHSNSLPLMDRVNTDSIFIYATADESGPHSRLGQSGRLHQHHVRLGSEARGSSAAVSRHSGSDTDEDDADVHDRKVQTLIQHLSRSGITNPSRHSPSTTAVDVPSVVPLDDGGGIGSPGLGPNGDYSPLNDSDSNTFPVFGGGWSGVGGGDVSAVTSNDWYARMRMKVSQDSDDEDAVCHAQPTPPAAPAVAPDTTEMDANVPTKPTPPPLLLNGSPSPKAKIDQNKDLFMQPPTPSAHASKPTGTDPPRAHFGSSSTNTTANASPVGQGSAILAPSAVMVSSLPMSRRDSLGSPLTHPTGVEFKVDNSSRKNSNNYNNNVITLAARMENQQQQQQQQQRLSSGAGLSRTSANNTAVSSPTQAAGQTAGTSAGATTQNNTSAVAPRAVYRRSSRKALHPSESMPQLSGAGEKSLAPTTQPLTPLHDTRAATAKGFGTTAAKTATTTSTANGSSSNAAATRPHEYVRPLSGAYVTSARSPFKSSATSRPAEAKEVNSAVGAPRRWSQAAEGHESAATTSAPQPKALHRSSGASDASPHPSPAKSATASGGKGGGYAAVRRQSTSAEAVPPSTSTTAAGAAGAATATVAYPTPPQAAAANTILMSGRTPQAPTSRRTTVHRRSSQAATSQ